MKGKLFLLVILLFAVVECSGKAPTKPFVIAIAGRVTDNEGNPLVGASITTNPPSASVTTDSNGQFAVSIGVEVGEYTITATKEGFKSVSVTIKAVEARQGQRADIVLPKTVIEVRPKIYVSPASLDFGNESSVKTFGISNTGSDTLRWKAVVNASWLSLTQSSGTVIVGTQVIEAQVKRQGMRADSYTGSIDITSNGGDQTVRVLMVVQTSPKLSLTPTSLVFEGNTNTLNFSIVNAGTGTLTWRASKNVPWISLSDTTGTTETETDRVAVTVNRTGLLPGKYQGRIDITSNGGTETILVTLSVAESPKLFVFPTPLDFGSTANMLYLLISNNGGGVLTWTVTHDREWMSVSPKSGTTTTRADSVAVVVSRTGLSPGTYEGGISVTSNGGSSSIRVAMTVASPNVSTPPAQGTPVSGTGNAPTDMALIPAGEFLMGSDDGEFDEKPQHRVYLDAFYIDIYEVTNRQYKAFCDATGRVYPPDVRRGYFANKPDYPVLGITWFDARDYCEWAGKRLPTEAEWEKAARGGLEGKKYPWGDKQLWDEANCDGTRGQDKWEHTSPVGSFPPNGYGLYDMAGNAYEWCADWYDANYYMELNGGQQRSGRLAVNPAGPATGTDRVIRGGSWESWFRERQMMVSDRNKTRPSENRIYDSYDYQIGFRCAKPVK